MTAALETLRGLAADVVEASARAFISALKMDS